VASGPAAAQTRPLVTEPASTGPAGGLVLEAGASGIAKEPNLSDGARRSRWDVPVLRLVVSPSANVELDVEWTARVVAVDDPSYGSVGDWGDVLLRAKWRFAADRAGRSALAVRFGVGLPETSYHDGLGPDTLRASIQLLATRAWGRAALHANAGLALQDQPIEYHAQTDMLAYGLALVCGLGRKWEAVAEIAGLGLGEEAPGAERRSEARAGFRFGGGRVRGDLALRRGLEDADGTWGVTTGLSWRLR
jgi:hypothetical protein